jgi:hypothetical protein
MKQSKPNEERLVSTLISKLQDSEAVQLRTEWQSLYPTSIFVSQWSNLPRFSIIKTIDIAERGVEKNRTKAVK